MVDRRINPNMQDILKYAIENSDNNGDSELLAKNGILDSERKQFLENVLSSMAVDVVSELQNAIHILEKEHSGMEEKIEALNAIRDLVGSIDTAKNFIQIGGSKVLFDCLNTNNSTLRINAAYVIAELSQNNPYCQEHFINAGALQKLIIAAQENDEIASSSMHAISTLVRNFEKGSALFIELEGLECILKCLQSANANLFVKSCFLMKSLAMEFDPIREEFVKLGAVYELAKCLDPVLGFDIKTETILCALCLLTETESGTNDLNSSKIKDTLQTIIDINMEKEECEEIIRDSKTLLGRLQK